jgi:pseudouridine kinase
MMGNAKQSGSSVQGVVRNLPGGVAGNIAAGLALMKKISKSEETVSLISVVGSDTTGESMIEALRDLGVDVQGVEVVSRGRTPCVMVILNIHGDVAASIADVQLVEEHLDQDRLTHHWSESISSASVVIMDGDLSPEALNTTCRLAKLGSKNDQEGRRKSILWFEPAAPDKAGRISSLLPLVDYISPNFEELKILTKTLLESSEKPSRHYTHCTKSKQLELINSALPSSLLDAFAMLCYVLDAGVQYILLTLGEQGADLCRKASTQGRSPVSILYAPALPAAVINCSGAGDNLVAGFVHALVNGAKDIETCLQWGIAMAKLTVESHTNWPNLQGGVDHLHSQDLRQLASTVSVQKFEIPVCCCCPTCLDAYTTS